MTTDQPARDGFTSLCGEFRAFCDANHLPDGDAIELLMGAELTRKQREWLSLFVARWDEAEGSPDFYGAHVI